MVDTNKRLAGIEQQKSEVENALSKIMYSLRDMNMEAKDASKTDQGHVPVVNLEGHPQLFVLNSWTKFLLSTQHPNSGMFDLMDGASKRIFSRGKMILPS